MIVTSRKGSSASPVLKQVAELFATLVPEVTVIEAERTTSGLVLTAVSHSVGAPCPCCKALSTRVHSYYTRRPGDVPICGQPAQLVLHLRRFPCLNRACPAVTFTERLPELIAPSAQRTTRLNELLRGLALAFGGEAGARQSERSAMPANGYTLLRRAHSAVPPSRPTLRVLGIDDFSFRKGQVFGTILTGGESHEVVEHLPDRTAETAAAWLQQHTGVEIVTRDRSADFARAISTGDPHAVQVADRFHLVKNAGEVLERVGATQPAGITSGSQGHRSGARNRLPQPPTRCSRSLNHSRIHSLRQREPTKDRQRGSAALPATRKFSRSLLKGSAPKAIAQRVGLTRQTVAIWLRAGSFPERPRSASRRMLITPYEPYLRERWQAGEQNSRQLWRGIQAQGFRVVPKPFVA
jgi:transposase